MVRCSLVSMLVGLIGCGRVNSNTSCSPPLEQCPDGCANLQQDRDHCGLCGTVCAATDVCSAGTCQPNCQTGLSECSGTCTNLASDALHCGTCSNACLVSESCISGACVKYGTGVDGDVS